MKRPKQGQEAVNMRSLDLKTSKHEGVAYISGLSRWRWAQAGPLPDSTGLHSRLRSRTRFLRCWRFWLALKNKQTTNLRQKYDLKILFYLINYYYYKVCLTAYLRFFCFCFFFKYDANSCILDRQAISWLMICAWVLTELCNNMLDHVLKMPWILNGCKWALKISFSWHLI